MAGLGLGLGLEATSPRLGLTHGGARARASGARARAIFRKWRRTLLFTLLSPPLSYQLQYPLTGTESHCSATEARLCEQLAQSPDMKDERPARVESVIS